MFPTLRQKARFFRRLSAGCKTGLQLDQSLHRDFLPQPYASASEQLVKDLRSGRPLAGTLLSAKMIAPWEARLLALGESTGQLEKVLADLAAFHEHRSTQFYALRAKLLYPFLVLVIAIVVQPLPRLAADTLSIGAYLAGVTMNLLLVYAVYFLCVVLPFERASNSAFSPLLIWSLRWIGAGHWIRLQFDIAYLNLLGLSLASGLDAAESLKMLQQNSTNNAYRHRHSQAIRYIGVAGQSLTQALTRSGVIKHPMVLGFLHINETSGALHDDLRTFVFRMKDETARTSIHFIKQVGLGLYLLGLGITLAGYL
jgi:type II secretory pathway component PulF